MRFSYRSQQNSLRLTLDEEPGDIAQTRDFDGRIDIAEQGRLVGIEIDANDAHLTELLTYWLNDPIARDYVEIDQQGAYVALSAPNEEISEQFVRTAELGLIAEIDGNGRIVAITIPRRGDGYEISFPSGNQ